MDVTAGDIKRLEDKLDRLADGMTRLILIDERQVLQFGRMEKLENRLHAVEEHTRIADARLTAWVQRGVGGWAAIAAVWTGWQLLHPALALVRP